MIDGRVPEGGRGRHVLFWDLQGPAHRAEDFLCLRERRARTGVRGDAGHRLAHRPFGEPDQTRAGQPRRLPRLDDDRLRFDANDSAFYYVRVLEIPTPRWTTYDAVKNKLPILEDVPATIQERAWTSPIWYKP